VMVTWSPPLFQCPRKIRLGRKNILSLVMVVYLVLFNNIFKTLNLFLNPAAWQWHLAALRTTEVLHRVLTWLYIGD
jgi:hypothetical protein